MRVWLVTQHRAWAVQPYPGFPLDRRTSAASDRLVGDRTPSRSTRIAARVGQDRRALLHNTGIYPIVQRCRFRWLVDSLIGWFYSRQPAPPMLRLKWTNFARCAGRRHHGPRLPTLKAESTCRLLSRNPARTGRRCFIVVENAAIPESSRCTR